jgi:predicted acylesterase/phospholipase RssA
MKRALVLGGGGSKGAYQAGAIKALNELGISFDIVVGTSIGALNGCLVAQQDYQLLQEIWDQVTVNDVIANGVNLEFDLGQLMKEKDEIIPFIQGVMKSGVDISPFKAMIDKALDEDRLLASNIDYGLTYVRADDLKLMTKTKFQMEKDMIKEYLLASASCYPAFPMQRIDNTNYIDGGYRDNVPIALAAKMGGTEFIVIPLDEDPIPKLDNYENVTLIKPFNSLGSFLNFDRTQLNLNQQRGYLDTLKVMGQYSGIHYNFIETDLSQVTIMVRISEYLSQWLPTQMDKKMVLNQWHYHWQQQLHPYGSFNYLRLVLRMIEVMAEILKIDPNSTYSIIELLVQISTRLNTNLNEISALDQKSYRKLSDFYDLVGLLKQEDTSLSLAVLTNMTRHWLSDQPDLPIALTYPLLINERIMSMLILAIYQELCDKGTQG